MDHTKILPDIGDPVSTDLLNLDALADASPGEVIYAATILNRLAADQMSDPETYHQVATFTTATGADWSGFQTQRSTSHEENACADQPDPLDLPTPPDRYVDCLPALGSMVSQLGRSHDVMMANFARMVEAVMSSQNAYLGTPSAEKGFRDAKHYLRESLKLSARAADKHLSRAARFTHEPGSDPEHEASQPKYSQLAESFNDGRLPGENADRIVAMDKDMTKYATKTGESVELKDEIMQALEPGLVEAAEAASPEEFSQTKARWMDRIAYELNPDGPSPSQALAKQADNALKTRRNADGGGRIWMDTTPAVFSKFTNLILHQSNFRGQTPNIDPDLAEILTADTSPDLDRAVPVENPDAVVGEDDEGNPVTAGYVALIDNMTQGQKLGAIVIGMLNTILSMEPTEIGLKKAHGASAQLVVVQDIETAYKTLSYPDLPDAAKRPRGPDGILPPHSKYRDGSGNWDPGGWTPFQSEALNNGPIHPTDADILGCNAEIVAQIWSGPDTVLNQKRTQRHHTPAQRRAILARDKGCKTPGCTIPAIYCDIHHITAWHLDGHTSETNAIAVCARHHSDIHDGKWTIKKKHGHTYFQPAPWLDPYQPLLRNVYWSI